eukprot:1193867-Pyramimonas_sp.AAC.1
MTTGTVTLSQQAAALQRGLGGLARTMTMGEPSGLVNFGVNIGGRHTDGVTYIMLLLSNKFGNLEGGMPTECRNDSHRIPRPRGRADRPDSSDSELWEWVRRAPTATTTTQPPMPRTQQQFDSQLERTRSHAHIAERTLGNIGGIFSQGHRTETFSH